MPIQCKKHPDSKTYLDRNRLRCARCNVEAVTRARRKRKEELVKMFGGKCMKCGYSRYIGALQFHHRDPKTKKFGVSHRGLTRSLLACIEEAKKCDLLCANCHAEEEA